MSVPDAASLAVKGFVAPLLLWRGWQNNKSEVERLREFLDYGQGLLSDVKHLSVEDFEDLQIDLNIVRTDFLNLQRKPAVLRGSGYKQYAEELTVLKRRVEEVARRFGQKLNIDTSKKMTKIERYQRKLLRESQQTRDMVREMKQEQIETPGGTSSDMVKPLVKEITNKIEENLRLNKDAEDALARAKQAERDLEEQVGHNARLRESLESARLEVARCQEAVEAAEAKAARHESVSAELEEELRTLRGQVTAARRRLQALDDNLARSNERVKEAKARIREVEKEMENKQKAISVSYARLKELRAWSSNRKAVADHDMVEFKAVAEARFQEQVEENGLLRGTVDKLTIEVQVLKKELKESREEVAVLTQLLQLGEPVASPEEPPAARPGPAKRHGQEEEVSARPDQSKTCPGAAAAAGGAAAVAAAHSKDGNHKQIPAPYYTIPAGVDHNIRNTAVDGHGHPDSFQQAGQTVTVKQGESIQGKDSEAEPLHQRALQLREALLGSTHPDVATSLEFLARMALQSGKTYTEMEGLVIRLANAREARLTVSNAPPAIEGRRQVGSVMSDLALALRQQKQEQAARAFPLFRRVYLSDEKILGCYHPLVAEDVVNLAEIVTALNKLPQAEELHRRALKIRQYTLGEDHPSTVASLSHLAVSLRAQGKTHAGDLLLRRAGEIRSAARSRGRMNSYSRRSSSWGSKDWEGGLGVEDEHHSRQQQKHLEGDRSGGGDALWGPLVGGGGGNTPGKAAAAAAATTTVVNVTPIAVYE